jgi:hypothetical protein
MSAVGFAAGGLFVEHVIFPPFSSFFLLEEDDPEPGMPRSAAQSGNQAPRQQRVEVGLAGWLADGSGRDRRRQLGDHARSAILKRHSRTS